MLAAFLLAALSVTPAQTDPNSAGAPVAAGSPSGTTSPDAASNPELWPELKKKKVSKKNTFPFPGAWVAAGVAFAVGVPALLASLFVGGVSTLTMAIIVIIYMDWDERALTLSEDSTSNDEFIPRNIWRFARLGLIASLGVLMASLILIGVGTGAAVGGALTMKE